MFGGASLPPPGPPFFSGNPFALPPRACARDPPNPNPEPSFQALQRVSPRNPGPRHRQLPHSPYKMPTTDTTQNYIIEKSGRRKKRRPYGHVECPLVYPCSLHSTQYPAPSEPPRAMIPKISKMSWPNTSPVPADAGLDWDTAPATPVIDPRETRWNEDFMLPSCR